MFSEDAVKEILPVMDSIATTSTGFLDFVRKIDRNTMDFYLQNNYEVLKACCNSNSAHLGVNGCLEFAGAMLLFAYSSAKKDIDASKSCSTVMMYACYGAPAGLFSDLMDNVINKHTNIPYTEWSAVYNYLDENYGSLIRRYEFAAISSPNDFERFQNLLKSK